MKNYLISFVDFQIYWLGPLSAGFLVPIFYQLVLNNKQRLAPEIAEEVPLTGVVTVDVKKSAQNLRQSSNSVMDAKQSNETQAQ